MHAYMHTHTHARARSSNEKHTGSVDTLGSHLSQTSLLYWVRLHVLCCYMEPFHVKLIVIEEEPPTKQHREAANIADKSDYID